MCKFIKYLFFGFGFFLPIKTTISNFFLILILISIIVDFFYFKRKEFYLKEIWYSFIPIYLFCLISLSWSFNVENGIVLLKRQSFLLFVPLVFALIPKNDVKELLKFSFYGLVSGVTLISFILLSNAGIRILNLKHLTIHRAFSSKQTSHQYISQIVRIHPSYLGMYTLFSMSILLFNKIKVALLIKIILLVIMAISIIFLNARILFFLFFLLVILKFFYIKQLRLRFYLMALSIMISVSLFFFLKNTYIVKKLITGSLWEITENIGTNNTSHKITSDSRMARWKAIIRDSNDSRIKGSGIGTEMSVVLSAYKNNELNVALKKQFNTHNQFIYYLITTGIIGVFIIIIIISQSFFFAVRGKDILMFYYTSIIMMLFLVENILYRNAGIIFVAVYFSLFFKFNLYNQK